MKDFKFECLKFMELKDFKISLKAERIVQLIQWQAMGWMAGILFWFQSVLGSLYTEVKVEPS